jgi:hypothetical protein
MGYWIVFIIYPQDEGPVHSNLWMNQTKQGTRILKVVCDSKWWYLFFYTLNAHVKFVIDTSGFHIAFTRSTCKIPSASIKDLRRRRRMAQNWNWGENSRYVSKFVYPTLSCMLSICSNVCVLYIVQCAKQPSGTVVYGYYAYEYLWRVWQIQPQLAVALESTNLVGEGKGRPKEHHSNSSRHM